MTEAPQEQPMPVGEPTPAPRPRATKPGIQEYYRIDPDGFFIEPVRLHEGEELPDRVIPEVWSNALSQPRWDGSKWVEGRPAAELLAQAKHSKKVEFANRMHLENQKLYPELDSAPGAWVAEMMLDVVSEPRGTRVTNIRSNKERRARGFTAVDAATTVAAVQNLKWETV